MVINPESDEINLWLRDITPLVAKSVSNESVIDTDHSTSYVKLEDTVQEHRPQVIPKTEVDKALPWVHIAISNTIAIE